MMSLQSPAKRCQLHLKQKLHYRGQKQSFGTDCAGVMKFAFTLSEVQYVLGREQKDDWNDNASIVDSQERVKQNVTGP
jgi:hypothetical protein